MSEAPGASADRPVPPALPNPASASTSMAASTDPSPTTSSFSSLNPVAVTFKPQKAHGLNAAAKDFVPNCASATVDEATASINQKLAAMNIGRAAAGDVVDAVCDTFQEVVAIAPSTGAYVLTCNTKTMPPWADVNTAITNLVAEKETPCVVQLNILAGPRFQSISDVAQWFAQSFGPYCGMIHHVQVVLVRCGEYISGKWTVPELDLEKYDPLKAFIKRTLEVVPKFTLITWGGSEQHCFNLKKQYYREALPAVQEAFQTEELGINGFSEVVDSKIMENIAKSYPGAQGQNFKGPESSEAADVRPPNGYPYTQDKAVYELQHQNVGQAWQNPDAAPMAPFFPQQYSQAEQSAPGYAPIHPKDPWAQQLKEVDLLHRKEGFQAAQGMPGLGGYGEAPCVPQNPAPTFGGGPPPFPGYQNMMVDSPYPSGQNGSMPPPYPSVADDHHPRPQGKKGKGKKYKGGRGGRDGFNDEYEYLDSSTNPATPYGSAGWYPQARGDPGLADNGYTRNGPDPYPYIPKFENPQDYNNNGYYQNNNGFHANSHGNGYGNGNGNGNEFSNGFGNGNGKGSYRSKKGKNWNNEQGRLHLKPEFNNKRGPRNDAFDFAPPGAAGGVPPMSLYAPSPGQQEFPTLGGTQSFGHQHGTSITSDRTVKVGNYAAAAGGYNGNAGGMAGPTKGYISRQGGAYDETKGMEW